MIKNWDRKKQKVRNMVDAPKSSDSINITTRGQSSLFYIMNFSISIINTTESPTDISLNKATISRKQAQNTLIGMLSTTDLDAGIFTYTLSGTDASSFNIMGAKLRSAVVFDYETKNSYSITINTTDQGELSDMKDFIIEVTDVDESSNQALAKVSITNNAINENELIRTLIGVFSTDDPNTNDVHSYGLQGADAQYFILRENSLFSAASFNYEAHSKYDFKDSFKNTNKLNTNTSTLPNEMSKVNLTLDEESIQLNLYEGTITFN